MMGFVEDFWYWLVFDCWVISHWEISFRSNWRRYLFLWGFLFTWCFRCLMSYWWFFWRVMLESFLWFRLWSCFRHLIFLKLFNFIDCDLLKRIVVLLFFILFLWNFFNCRNWVCFIMSTCDSSCIVSLWIKSI